MNDMKEQSVASQRVEWARLAWPLESLRIAVLPIKAARQAESMLQGRSMWRVSEKVPSDCWFFSLKQETQREDKRKYKRRKY